VAPNFVYYNFVLYEAFNEFHASLNDIVNSSFNRSEKMLNNRIVRKIMKKGFNGQNAFLVKTKNMKLLLKNVFLT
jgi:hypothetical protein